MTGTATDTHTTLKALFCEWCPSDCEKLGTLTAEERAGCVASGGFADVAVKAIDVVRFHQAMADKVEWYRHHNRSVAVVAGRRGGHRAACLCYRCGKFNPDNPDDNCPTANLIYAACVLTGVVTPIWECPDFA